MFSVFDPRKFPVSLDRDEGVVFYGVNKIEELAVRFDVDKAEAVSEWRDLLEAIIADPRWCSMKNSKPRNFWAVYLTRDDFEIGPAIRRLLQVTLSLPIGSADAERAFSVLAHIRNKRRSRLKPTSVDALIRIRMNGSKKLEEFNAAKYAKSWLAMGHSRTDSKAVTKKPRITLYDTDGGQDKDNVNNEYMDGSALF